MDHREYYEKTFENLEKQFDYSHFVLAYGPELIKRGWDPYGLLVTVEPTSNLHKLSVEEGMEIFVPVMNSSNGQEVDNIVIPFDFEVYHPTPGDLYANQGTQAYYFEKYVVHVEKFLRNEFERFNIPHVEDWTPSGGHFLTRVWKGTPSWDALVEIGNLPYNAIDAYNHLDLNDLKRNPVVGEEAGRAFQGAAYVAEFMAMRAVYELGILNDLPTSLWDSKKDTTLSVDISWTADAGYMRIIRAVGGLHRKRQKYIPGSGPMVDVQGRYFDGKEIDIHNEDLEHILNCQWDIGKASEHAQNFPGGIPSTYDELTSVVDEIKKSNFWSHYQSLNERENVHPSKTIEHIKNNRGLTNLTRNMMNAPHDRFLKPSAVRKFVKDLHKAGYPGGNVKDVFEYVYNMPFDWYRDNMKNPSSLKADAFVRHFDTLAALEEGEFTL